MKSLKEGYQFNGDTPNKIELDAMQKEKTSFATMSRNSSGISITFSGSSSQDGGDVQKLSRRGSGGKDHSGGGGFGTPVKLKGRSPSYAEQDDISLQLTAVKLKLEERRRKIEDEKKKMEVLMSKQREKVGQEAFLRAVSKGIKKAGNGTHELPECARAEILQLASKVGDPSGVGGGGGAGSVSSSSPPAHNQMSGSGSSGTPVKRPFSLKFNNDQQNIGGAVQTPEMEALDISRMSDSLYSLQSDIQRLALQQTQIQNLMNTSGGNPGNERVENKPFYISDLNSQANNSVKPSHSQPFYISTNADQQPSPASYYTPVKLGSGGVRHARSNSGGPAPNPYHHQQQPPPPQQQVVYSSAPSSGHQQRRTWANPQPVQFQQQPPPPAPYGHGPSPPYGPGQQQQQQQQFPPTSSYPPHHQQVDQFGRTLPPQHQQHWPPSSQPPSQPLYPNQPPAAPVSYAPLDQPGGVGYPTHHLPPHSNQPPSHYPLQPNYQQQQQHPVYTPQQHTRAYTTEFPMESDQPRRSAPLSRNSSFKGRNYELNRSLSASASHSNVGSPQHDLYPVHHQGRVLPRHSHQVDLNRSAPMPDTGGHYLANQDLDHDVEDDEPEDETRRHLNTSAPLLSEAKGSPARRSYQFTQVEERRKPATAEKPSLSASFLQQKRRNAETYELRPKSANPEHSSVHPNHPHEPGFLSGGRGENESNAEEMGETQDADVDEGSRTSSAGAKATTFLELSASPNTHKFARVSPVPPPTSPPPLSDPDPEPEMSSSTMETLSRMKTESIAGKTGGEAKGFVISFDDASPVKPKPFLKPKKFVRRDDSQTKSSPPPVAPVSQSSSQSSAATTAVTTTETSSNDGGRVEDVMESRGDVTDGNDNCEAETTNVNGVASASKGDVEPSLVPASPADKAVAESSKKCVLCEIAQATDEGLQVCAKCLRSYKYALNNVEALPACPSAPDATCTPPLAGAEPAIWCQKCQLEKGRQLGLPDRVRAASLHFFDQQNSMSADEKKQEWVQMMTLKRKQQSEESRAKREEEARRRREEEELRKEELMRKKEEDKRRREEILEQHRIKKEQEKEDKPPSCPPSSAKFGPKLRPRSAGGGKPRPKTIHVDNEDVGVGRSTGLRGSQSNLSINSLSRTRYHGSLRRGSNVSLHEEDMYAGSLRGLGHIGRSKSSSASNLGPGSLPLGLRHARGRDFDDGASDISSTTSGYRSGRVSARLYREPQSKSNRPIIMNAIEYVVYPGAVNQTTRLRVLEEIERCDCPHFLLLFRDSRLQFRALYAFYPDTEEVFKIYGTGPKQITDNMMELYYKYNSGGKKFTQIHTKHLTCTIDAFTIHNSLWLGKKSKLPDKKDLPLVI